MTEQYTGDLEPLIRWAVNRGCSNQDSKAPPEPYKSWVENLLPEKCRGSVGWWIGIVTPESKASPDWVDRYPHRHVDSMGWDPQTTTIITYLVAPQTGGRFAMGGGAADDPYNDIKITPGLTISMDAATWHGVRPVGKGTRIALICTGQYQE